MKREVKERNSSIELLRIVIMIMIIGCHFATHGDFSFDSSITISKLWLSIIEMGGNFGVDVFVIISGYYLLIKNELKINLKKVLKLWGQVFFYSIVCFVIGIIIGKVELEIEGLLTTLLPVIYGQWWFASTYFVLFLIHPYINKFLLSLNKKQYQLFLLSIIILWSIIPMLTNSKNQSNALIEFIMYYSIGGYISKYGIGKNLSLKKWFLLWITISFIKYLSSIMIMVVGLKFNAVSSHTSHFYQRNSLLTIIQSISFFMIFININIKNNTLINSIASSTFGIYLIHDNRIISDILWHDIFKNAVFQNSIMLIPYSLLVTIIVFSICAIVDLIRQNTFEKLYLTLSNKLSIRLENTFKKYIEYISNYIFK